MTNNDILFGDVTSEGGELNAKDWRGLARTGGLVVASALVTWLLSIIPGLDLGKQTTVILPIVTFLLETARRWLGSQTPDAIGKAD